MLAEIHKSKISFCEYAEDCFSDFDLILNTTEEISLTENIQLAKEKRASRLAAVAFKKATLEAPEDVKVKLSTFKIDPATIQLVDLVFRVITYEHIPLSPGRKKTPKTVADHHVKLNFIPFKHYILETDEEAKVVETLKGNLGIKEVLRSHSKNSKFEDRQGSITNKLAKMFILMVNKYSQRANWRGYSYLDEMKGQALLQLSLMGLQFAEAKSNNPFAYYTQSISNAFVKVLNIEKRNQNLRDELLIESGQNPSYAKQLELEEAVRKMRAEPE